MDDRLASAFLQQSASLAPAHLRVEAALRRGLVTARTQESACSAGLSQRRLDGVLKMSLRCLPLQKARGSCRLAAAAVSRRLCKCCFLKGKTSQTHAICMRRPRNPAWVRRLPSAEMSHCVRIALWLAAARWCAQSRSATERSLRRSVCSAAVASPDGSSESSHLVKPGGNRYVFRVILRPRTHTLAAQLEPRDPTLRRSHQPAGHRKS